MSETVGTVSFWHIDHERVNALATGIDHLRANRAWQEQANQANSHVYAYRVITSMPCEILLVFAQDRPTLGQPGGEFEEHRPQATRSTARKIKGPFMGPFAIQAEFFGLSTNSV